MLVSSHSVTLVEFALTSWLVPYLQKKPMHLLSGSETSIRRQRSFCSCAYVSSFSSFSLSKCDPAAFSTKVYLVCDAIIPSFDNAISSWGVDYY